MTLTFGELSASQILVGKIGLGRAVVKGDGCLLLALFRCLHGNEMVTVPAAGDSSWVLLHARH